MLWVYIFQGYIYYIYNIYLYIIFIIYYIYKFFLAVSIENTGKIYPWRGYTHNIFISFQNILIYENEKNIFFQKFSSIFFLLSWSPHHFFSFVVIPPIFFLLSVKNNHTTLTKFFTLSGFFFCRWKTIIFQNKKVFYPAG